jgi:gamma-glutamylaminecyclotransferase
MPILVFVYGTLKKGYSNNHVLTRNGTAKLLSSNAAIRGKMYDLGPFPAVTAAMNEDDFVKGEIWEVSSKDLDRLDHLEGHPRFYIRVRVPLLSKHEGISKYQDVYTYLMPKSRLPKDVMPVPAGFWQPNK